MLTIGIVIAVIVLIAWSGFFIVEQQTTAVVERFGRYVRTARAGLNFKIPLIEMVGGRVSLRVRQLDVPVETKTQDNVFVKVAVSVQFHVLTDSIFAAFYKLESPETQITSFVFDVVRARVPKMRLDDVFEKKDEIADAVRAELTEIMNEFGYGIVKALVTDIDPDAKVKAAMNEINEAERLRVAANERGEAEKILKVKQAEADARSNALQGQGIADQRKAIIDGLKDSIDDFQKAVPGTDPQQVMNLVLITQYFDMLKGVGGASNSNAILIPHSPGALTDISGQLRDMLITANQVNVASGANKAQQ
jgi:regulator of protease activity HflC (stomatin/prohibitin superfamily)